MSPHDRTPHMCTQFAVLDVSRRYSLTSPARPRFQRFCVSRSAVVYPECVPHPRARPVMTVSSPVFVPEPEGCRHAGRSARAARLPKVAGSRHRGGVRLHARRSPQRAAPWRSIDAAPRHCAPLPAALPEPQSSQILRHACAQPAAQSPGDART
eukprot:scaffold14346_cov40-Phaeocystis_antarctica.AAC.1